MCNDRFTISDKTRDNHRNTFWWRVIYGQVVFNCPLDGGWWWVSLSVSSHADHGPSATDDRATPRRRLSRHLFKCTRSDPLTNGRQAETEYSFGNPIGQRVICIWMGTVGTAFNIKLLLTLWPRGVILLLSWFYNTN